MTENEARSILDVRISRFDHAGDVNEALEIAKQALKEIQLYKDGKLCLVPEDVYSKQCCKLDAYKEIGTVEECREAVEKQKPKEPTVLKQQHSDFYNCPKCGRNLILKCGTDWFGGQHYKSCPNCGQAIQWENLKGMEDEQP